MPDRSTIASPTLTPALNVFSKTAPLLTLRSLLRTNAPPFPGFTCWNSMIWKRVPSSSSVIPFLKSFVETLTQALLEFDQLSSRSRDRTAALARDLHHVLDPDAAEPRHVDARF